MTDEPIDQLKALQEEARKSLSTDHRTFYGLDELREFQRQVREAEATGRKLKRFTRARKPAARKPKSP